MAQTLPAPRQLPPQEFEGREVADVVPRSTAKGSVPIEKIMGMIQTKPKRKFSWAVLDEDYRRLMASKNFKDIKAWPEMTQDGRVNVFFNFEELPNVIQEIVYQGAKHLKDEELNTITGLQKGMHMNPLCNKLACQAIVKRYREKGKPFAHCELLEGDKEGDTRVVFNITEGSVVKVSKIEFTGNHFVYDSRLKTQINSSQSFIGLGGDYNPDMADADVIKLKEYYKSFGYHDIRVSRETTWDEDQRSVRLTYHLDEGPRYTVKSVSIHGNSAYKEDELLRFVKLKPGDIFDQGKVDAAEDKLTQYGGYRGRKTSVHDEVYFSSDKPEVDLHLNVEERPPAHVGQIFIIGNDVTRQNVILRQMPLYPGQLLSYPDLRLTENNLARLNIFESNPEQGVRPTVTVDESNPDSSVKDIIINVQETATGSLIFGLGVNSNNGLNGSIVLNERNFDILRPPTSWDDLMSGRAFRGAGQELRIEAMPGTQLQRYSISFREPFLFNSPYSLGLSGYYFTRIYNEYTEERPGGRISIGRKLNDQWTVNTSVRVENVGVHNVPFFAPVDYTSVVGNNFLTGLRAGVTRDTRDSYLRATEGSVVDVSFEQDLGAFDFPVANLEFNKYFTTYQRPDNSGRHVLAWRTQVGVAGSHTPVYERFFAGGFRTIRGFQFRGVGPNVNGFMTGGDFMLLNSLEYQIPVKANDSIYLVGFVDSGTVESNVEIKDYRVTTGVGARIIVPMLGPMPIALDFGFPIVQAQGDRTQIFSFWVGFFH